MKKMQENMKKKYSCDRSTTATRLEDLLQDAVVSSCSSRLVSPHQLRHQGDFTIFLFRFHFSMSINNRRRENS